MLRHWFFTIIALFRLFFTFSKAFWRFRYGLDRLLELPEKSRLSQTELHRLRHYYLGTQYLSVIFCSLRGQGKNAQEQQLFFELSALAAFFDDLVDAQRGILRSPPDNPITFGHMADERKLALHFFQNVLQGLPKENQPMFQDYMQRLYTVEIKGQQWAHGTEMSDIEKTTAEKGSCAVLLFRCLLQPLPATQEHKALMAFGYLIQLSDDIFDLWFDRQEKVATLATLLADSGRVGELMGLFETQLARTKQAFFEIPVSKFRIHVALACVHALTAITRTSLLRYQQLTEKSGELPLENRQMMVVDMGKWSNRLIALRYLLFSR